MSTVPVATMSPLPTTNTSSTVNPVTPLTSTPAHTLELSSEAIEEDQPDTPVENTDVATTLPGRDIQVPLFWGNDATEALVKAWAIRQKNGVRNLSTEDWSQITRAVNAIETAGQKSQLQCRRKLDKLKKEYRKQNALVRGGGAKSTWKYYDQFDVVMSNVTQGLMKETTPAGKTNEESDAFNVDGEDDDDEKTGYERTSMPVEVQEDASKKRKFATMEKDLGAQVVLISEKNTEQVEKEPLLLRADASVNCYNKLMEAVERMRTEVMNSLERSKQDLMVNMELKHIESQHQVQLRREEIDLRREEMKMRLEERRMELDMQTQLRREEMELRREEMELKRDEMKMKLKKWEAQLKARNTADQR